MSSMRQAMRETERNMDRFDWLARHTYEQLHELEQSTFDTHKVVQVVDMHSVAHKEELRFKIV